jgi:PST family polysaccharide transporter
MFAVTPVDACSWAYFSLGKSKQLLHWTLMATPLYVLGFVVGLPFGAKGVALCYSLMMAVSVVPCFAFQVRWMPLRWTELWRAWLPATAAGVIAALLARSIANRLPPLEPFVETVRAAVLAGLIYAVEVTFLVALDWIESPRKMLATLRG